MKQKCIFPSWENIYLYQVHTTLSYVALHYFKFQSTLSEREEATLNVDYFEKNETVNYQNCYHIFL